MSRKRERLKIVLVGPFPPPYGGMAVQAQLLQRLLATEGVDVECVDYTAPLPRNRSRFEKLRGLRTVIRWRRFVRRVRQLAQPERIFHVLACSYGSFFLWTVPCLIICRRRGVPIIVNYRGGAAERFLSRYRRFVVPLLRMADRIIVPSGFLFFTFVKFGLYSEVIPNILELGIGAREEYEEGPLTAPRFIVNRNFEPIYNVRMALLAFAIIQARFSDASLRLIGDGSQRQELEGLVADLGIRNVEFLGQMENEEALKILRDADILLNPTNVDNMPISLLEAMALGVPIVTTDAGGIPYILEDRKTALLVPCGDHLAMAEAAMELVTNGRLRARLRRRAMKQAGKYRWRKVWPLWRRTYSEVAQRKRLLAGELTAA